MVELEQGAGLTVVGPEMNGAVVRAREFDSEVVAVEPIMGDSSLLSLATPTGFAAAVRPGQFVDVLCRVAGSYDPLLRRPYSVYRVDPARDRIDLLVRPFGRGSTWLAARKPGDVLDVLGPLGNAFEIHPRSTNLLMVAGGVGVAPLVFLAETAASRHLGIAFLMGSANGDGLLTPTELPRSAEYVVATDDGSQGHHGFITDLVPGYARWADQVFACGPEPMFVSLRNTLHPHRLGGKPKVQISMERTMACGLGACLGCVVETRHGMQTSCVQGPIYDIDEVVWQ